MSFQTKQNLALRKRLSAINNGIPSWALDFCDARFNKALQLRNASSLFRRNVNYKAASDELEAVIKIFNAFLDKKYFGQSSTPYLDKLLETYDWYSSPRAGQKT